MKLFLIGFMGAGKTTLAAQLAKQHSVSFVDLDEYIESKEGMSIPQIFSEKGPRYFRQKERDALQELLFESEPQIIATGGGTPFHYKNLKWMKKRGTVVYIYVPWHDLLPRLKKVQSEQNNRPLLQNRDENQWFDLYKKRDPKYRQAHIICDVSADEHLDLLTKRPDLFTKA